MSENACNYSGKILKKLLIGFSVFLAVVILSACLFVHFYFGRTLPNQVSGMVIRCSDGMSMKCPDSAWLPLKAGDRLKKGNWVLMPETGPSFISFDGVRLLSNNSSEIEISGSRSFSLIRGGVAVAAAPRNRALRISVDTGSLETNDSVLNLSGAGNAFSVGCISGTATFKTRRNTEHLLAAGEKAVIIGESVQIAAADAQHPFAMLEDSIIERIRERFNRVISKYAHRLPAVPPGKDSGRSHVRRGLDWAGRGLRFVSYMEGDFLNLAREDFARSTGEYYEALFVPSNRLIAMGREKVLPLEPHKGGTWPTWSHDGTMIAFTETERNSPYARARVVRLDDLDNPWDISQEYDTVLPMFGLSWAPDDRHVLFLVTDNLDYVSPTNYRWNGPYKIKIAPVDPAEGPLTAFDSPFYDIPLRLPIPVGKTISPNILKLPWGDAMLCANWGNLAYIPIQQDGQSVANAPGVFLTNFNPREVFVMGGDWSPSGSKICFTAVKDLKFSPLNSYILYDVEDILDGFSPPPRSIADPRIKQVAPTENGQFSAGFSFDESLVFLHEDVNGTFRTETPTSIWSCDFDVFYANALQDEPGMPTQIHLPGNQMFLTLSPEGNRIAYCNYTLDRYELRIVSFDIEADIDVDLGGVLIDNSGTNLIVPPGALQQNFNVKISTPFVIKDEANIHEGESHFFAMRLIDAQGLENPKFIEPMTLTIRYTDDEVAGLDEGMLEIYYQDESDPEHPAWVPLGGTVDPEHNEITVEIQHFSKFSIGARTGSNP